MQKHYSRQGNLRLCMRRSCLPIYYLLFSFYASNILISLLKSSQVIVTRSSYCVLGLPLLPSFLWISTFILSCSCLSAGKPSFNASSMSNRTLEGFMPRCLPAFICTLNGIPTKSTLQSSCLREAYLDVSQFRYPNALNSVLNSLSAL